MIAGKYFCCCFVSGDGFRDVFLYRDAGSFHNSFRVVYSRFSYSLSYISNNIIFSC